jgi:hypothetical protein
MSDWIPTLAAISACCALKVLPHAKVPSGDNKRCEVVNETIDRHPEAIQFVVKARLSQRH